MASTISTNRPGLIWKIFTHPLALVMTFLMIIVAGQYMATLFYQNLWAGFINKELYGLLGITGVIVLLVNLLLHPDKHLNAKRNAGFNLLGVLFILFSAILFFSTTDWTYINQSFNNPFSVAGIILFLFICICTIIRNVRALMAVKKQEKGI
jgi:hypothetical protein